MKEIFTNFYDVIMNTIDALGIYGPFLGCLFIVLESIFPPLPLFVFITINFVAFGNLLGFLISWFFTVLGCMLSYVLIKKYLSNWVRKKIKNVNLLNKCLSYMGNLSLTQITVILSIPFTPAFMMNIAAGISNIDFKKYLISVLISKIFLVYFWGMIGTGLIESFKNPTNLVTIVIMVLASYLISIVIKKIFKLD